MITHCPLCGLELNYKGSTEEDGVGLDCPTQTSEDVTHFHWLGSSFVQGGPGTFQESQIGFRSLSNELRSFHYEPGVKRLYVMIDEIEFETTICFSSWEEFYQYSLDYEKALLFL